MRYLIILIVAAVIPNAFMVRNSLATVRTVCASGCGYTSIQSAVTASASGDTVSVAAGYYPENVTVDKAIQLLGAGADTTVVEAADPERHTIEVRAYGTQIRGVTVTGATGVCGSDWGANGCAGILLNYVADSTVSEVRAVGNNIGIYVFQCNGTSAGNCLTNPGPTLITNNTVSNNVDGIVGEYSKNISIENNKAVNNTNRGIELFNVSNSSISHNIASGNYISTDSSCNGTGMYLWRNDLVTVIDNTVSYNCSGMVTNTQNNITITSNSIANNSERGIFVWQANYNNINNNYISNNSNSGIYVGINSKYNTINTNYIVANGIGYESYNSQLNTMYDNYFSNTSNAVTYTSYPNTWNTVQTEGVNIIGGAKIGGNFWSSLACTDGNSDGFCDANYTMNSANIDSLPLALSALRINTLALNAAAINAAYTQTLAASGGSGALTWEITSGTLPIGLTLNSSSGVISGSPTAPGTIFEVQVRDGQMKTAKKKFFIHTHSIPVIATIKPQLPGALTETPYSETLYVEGGARPYTWTILSGSLPDGLQLDSATGEIHGRPTTVGGSAFTVKITDAQLNAATKAFSLQVAYTVPTIPAAGTFEGTINKFYTGMVQSSGGISPFTWGITAGALPPGLTFNQATGAIYGTPTQAGAFSFTVQLGDGQGNTTAPATYQFLVYAQPVVTTESLPNATLNQFYDVDLTATGGKSPYTWRVISGSIPWAILLFGDTGSLAGTPRTTGNSTFTVEVKDSLGVVAAKQLTLKVVCADADGDGYSAVGGTCGLIDCNDADPLINPGASESCDALDNNCNGQTDEGLTFDLDNDGHSTLPSCAGTRDDCDDNNPNKFPGNSEICDSVDNTCDGQVDEGLTYDLDNDGHTTPLSCQGTRDDCDDANSQIKPGVSESCDGVDNNCDGQVDEGLSHDLDNDGHTTPLSCQGARDDCDDNSPIKFPGNAEVCDALDNNCDGFVDEEFGSSICPVIEVSPLTHDYGFVEIGKSALQTVTVSNTGNGVLQISNTSVVADYTVCPEAGCPVNDAAAYGIASNLCLGTSIPPGGSCTLDVIFTPQTATAGKKLARLVIASNVPGTLELSVPLEGRDGLDSDGDGIVNGNDNCPYAPNPNQANLDGDVNGDACDPFPNNPSEWADSDGDTLGNNTDNCPYAANADQADADMDGVGNVCDVLPESALEWRDSDGDGVGDNADNCVATFNAGQSDADNDARGDACDSKPSVANYGSVIDAPHNDTHGVKCGDCHSYSLWWRHSPTAASTEPDYAAITNAVCAKCHRNSAHIGISPGGFSVKCVDCHNAHSQAQLDWRSIVALDDLYLQRGTIDGNFSVNGGQTTFAYSLVESDVPINSEWSDPASWGKKNAVLPPSGLILVVDTANATNTYEVVSATDSTICIKGGIDPGKAGKTFGLIYGQMIKKNISTPSEGSGEVKFFNPRNPTGGYTDSNSPSTGICQICHASATMSWNSSGSGSNPGHDSGLNCVECHTMAQGFRP